MNKTLKIIGIIIVCIVLIWGIYVTVDCIRLRNGKGTKPLITIGEETKPLITIGEEKTEYRTTYKGLGYTIKYYVDIGNITENDGMTYIEQLGYGAEFRVFNILIWAWVE